MNFYLSNFRLSAKHPKAVGIALGIPKWYKGRNYPALNPPFSLKNKYKDGKITDSTYIKLYKKYVLSKLNPQEVANDLGDGAVLLCWCEEGAFCHRDLVATWLRKSGHTVGELKNQNKS